MLKNQAISRSLPALSIWEYLCQALYFLLGKHKVGDPLKINDDPRELLLMWVLASDIYHFIN